MTATLRRIVLCLVTAQGTVELCGAGVILRDGFDDGDFTTGVVWRVPFGGDVWRVEDGRLLGARHVAEGRNGYPAGNCLETDIPSTARPVKGSFYYTNSMHCPSNSVSISLLRRTDGGRFGGYVAMTKFQYKHCKFHLHKRTATGLTHLASGHGPSDEVGRFVKLELRVLSGERIELWYDHVLALVGRDDQFGTFDTLVVNNEHQQGGAHAALDEVVVATARDRPPDDFPGRPEARRIEPEPGSAAPSFVLADARLHARLSGSRGGQLVRLVHNAAAPGTRDGWMAPILWWGRGLPARPGLFTLETPLRHVRQHAPRTGTDRNSASLSFRRDLEGKVTFEQTFTLDGTGVLRCRVSLTNRTDAAARIPLSVRGEPLAVADHRVRLSGDGGTDNAGVCSPDSTRSTLQRRFGRPSRVRSVRLSYVLDRDMNSPRIGIGVSGPAGTCRFEVPRHPGHRTELEWRERGADSAPATRRQVYVPVGRRTDSELRVTATGLQGVLNGTAVLELTAPGPGSTLFDTAFIAVNGATVRLVELGVSGPAETGAVSLLQDRFDGNWPDRYEHLCPGLTRALAVTPQWYYFYVPRPNDVFAWRALPGAGTRRQDVSVSRGWVAFVETTFRRGLLLGWPPPYSGDRIELGTTATDIGWRLQLPPSDVPANGRVVREFYLTPFLGLTGVRAANAHGITGAHRTPGGWPVFRPDRPYQLTFSSDLSSRP